MDLRASPSTAEGGTRSRSLRGKVLAWPASPCIDDHDRVRVPPTSPPHKSGAGKKESTARHLNRPCQPSATPSTARSFHQIPSGVRIAQPGSGPKSSVSKSAKVVLAAAAHYMAARYAVCSGMATLSMMNINIAGYEDLKRAKIRAGDRELSSVALNKGSRPFPPDFAVASWAYKG